MTKSKPCFATFRKITQRKKKKITATIHGTIVGPIFCSFFGSRTQGWRYGENLKVSSTSSQPALPCSACFDVFMFRRPCGRWSGGVPRTVVVLLMILYLYPPIYLTNGDFLCFWLMICFIFCRRPHGADQKNRPIATPCSIVFFSGLCNR